MNLLKPSILALLLASTAFAGSPMRTQGEQALANKDYLAALPLLQQAAEFEKSNADEWKLLRDKIDECKKHLTAEQINAASWKPAVPAAPARTPHAPPQPAETRALGIKELGNFTPDPEKANQVPADVVKLNGMKVTMWGFMIPSLQADKVTEFALVPSLAGCCYGQPPGVEHTIVVHNGKLPVAYTTKPIRVTGTLRVKEKRDSDYTIGIFEIDPDKVEVIEVEVPAAELQGKAQIDLSNQK